MNDKFVTIKMQKKDKFFILQIVMVLIMLTIGGVSLFIKDFRPYFFLLLSINMIVLIVNNYLFLKRPYIWIVYAAFAIYTFILFLQGIL